SASENTQSVEGSWDDKLISNVCINAVGLDYRFQGVPSPQAALRLYQAMAAGSGLDFCIIGVFADYPDRKSLPAVRDIYGFHKKNEKYYGNFEAVPDVLLVKPGPHPSETQSSEYLGVFRMLKEAHITFRVAEQRLLSGAHIENAKLILCADCVPGSALMDVLEKAQALGKAVVWTGTAWADGAGPRFLEFFSLKEAGTAENGRWGYLLNRPESLFPHLTDTDWTMLDGRIVPLKGTRGATYGLERISAGYFGPPEMCGGNTPSGEYALIRNEDRKTMLFSFHPGALYKRYGYDEHKHCLMDPLLNGALFTPSLQTSAPECVELFLNRYSGEGGTAPAVYNLQLINLSGFNGSSFHSPCPADGITVEIKWDETFPPSMVEDIGEKQHIEWSLSGGYLRVEIPRITEYKILIIK
ncbi:hypothetical protein LJC14_06235, partial [Treponema sp. OttesenSCG-928-L16]|nr:hypothetical protein [Treponema sp. OttesenSCG-928-L16]